MPRFPGARLTRSIPNAVVIGGDSINPRPLGLIGLGVEPRSLEPKRPAHLLPLMLPFRAHDAGSCGTVPGRYLPIFHVPSTSIAETARCIRTALAGFKRYFQGYLELVLGHHPSKDRSMVRAVKFRADNLGLSYTRRGAYPSKERPFKREEEQGRSLERGSFRCVVRQV